MIQEKTAPTLSAHRATIDGHTLAYFTAGSPDAPPLLMVHGWGSFHGVWRQTIPALQDHFYCVAVDLLGYGDSDKVRGADYGIEAQARRVVALADHLGFDRFNLIGHSMGGQTVLTIAALVAPERVIKVVDVSGVVAAKLAPAAEATIPNLKLIERFFFLYPYTRWLMQRENYIRKQMTNWFYDMDCMPLDEWAEDRYRMMQPDSRYAMIPSAEAMYALDLTPHLSKISLPVLVIFGQQDEVVPVSDGHLADEHISDSHLVLIDQCGHFPMYEKTGVYLDAVKEFLIV
jgi:pimeloyl-ACP methyl ester carboxylesterase